MGRVLHPRAATTEATRQEVQNSQESINKLAKRFGINRLPESESKPAKKKRFKNYSIGYFHLDFRHVRTEQGKRCSSARRRNKSA